MWSYFGVEFGEFDKDVANGPKAINLALTNLYWYSIKRGDETLKDVFNVGVLKPKNFRDMVTLVGKKIKEIKAEGKKPIILGGEHHVTYGALKALGKVNVVQFDAHFDLCDNDPDLGDKKIIEKNSRATFMRRAIEQGYVGRLIQIGIREGCKEEEEFAKKNDIKVFTSWDVKKSISTVKNELRKLPKPVYVTIDIDVLDPSIAPSVGTPIPGGLDIETLLGLLECIKEPVGFDIVEVAAPKNPRINDVTAMTATYILREWSTSIR